jgi:hypothetical protein
MKNRILAAAFAVLAAGATAVSAGSCGYDYCWGAVGIGTNGAYGWAHSYSNENDAYWSVQNSCQGNCETIKTFYNTCGAIATSPNGAWGWGWHDDLDTAKSIAMNYCMDNGYNCAPRVWACSK